MKPINFIEPNSSWEADRSSASQQVRCSLCNRCNTSYPPVPILSQINPAHVPFYFLKFRFNNILPFKLMSPKCFFFSCLSAITHYACVLKIYNQFKILMQSSVFCFSSLSILKMLAYEIKVLLVCMWVCMCVYVFVCVCVCVCVFVWNWNITVIEQFCWCCENIVFHGRA